MNPLIKHCISIPWKIKLRPKLIILTRKHQFIALISKHLQALPRTSNICNRFSSRVWKIPTHLHRGRKSHQEHECIFTYLISQTVWIGVHTHKLSPSQQATSATSKKKKPPQVEHSRATAVCRLWWCWWWWWTAKNKKLRERKKKPVTWKA